ncbi:hypothetical protein ACOT19_00730 [Acinetobacter baumannii]
MTDLNKERELCNQSFEKYWDDFCEAYGNGFDRSLAKLFFANAWGEAKAQAVPEWISIEDCLPDEGDLVLGISKTKLAKFNVYQVVALDEFEECEINYWMPLPTVPSESGAEQ